MYDRGWYRVALVLSAAAALGGCAEDGAEDEARGLTLLEQAAIYGADDRRDLYDHPDAGLRELTRRSVVALIDAADLDESVPALIRPLGPTLGEAYGLCPGERFREQPTAAFCSGTLIDDDLVLTAGHCVEDASFCATTRFVFNYHYEAAGALATITADDVYGCQQVVVARTPGFDGHRDYAIVQLDRPVSAPHTPATVETSAAALSPGAALTLIGFGSGLPAKIDTGGSVIDARAQQGDYFSSTIDAFGGNSGSGVFDASQTLVGILDSGASDYDYTPAGCLATVTYPADGSSGGERSTYAHNAVVALCAAGWPSARLCDPTPACGDGACAPGEPLSCPIDCAVCGDGTCAPGEPGACPTDCSSDACGDGTCAPGEPLSCPSDCDVEAPDDWRCVPEWYGARDGCDCECGARDPDCEVPGQTLYGCPSEVGWVCDEAAACEDVGSDVATGWTCPPAYYATRDGCDCACGAPDPDCDDPDQPLYGCPDAEGWRCSASAVCEPSDGAQVPGDWTCAPEYYATRDGCDCDCGARDPDCEAPDQTLFNCPDAFGWTCNPDGLCEQTDSEGPPGWQCSAAWYGALDGCDCLCGALDPDCLDPTQPVLGCEPGQVCGTPAGVCLDPGAAPEEPAPLEPEAEDEGVVPADNGLGCSVNARRSTGSAPGALGALALLALAWRTQRRRASCA